MPKIWKIIPRIKPDIKEQLLLNRGLKTKRQVEQFFHPRVSEYQDLLKIPGIDSAGKIIKQAIKDQKQIYVYGDYDVDGVSAAAVTYHGLKSIGAKILPYIPHREKEGYGLSKFGLDEIKKAGGQLVITVDHGIVALEQARYAKEIGLDLIITDHHTPLDKPPQALAIVHSTAMCGAGVVWCLIKTLVDGGVAQELLQFVALGTVSDMIPLTDLGRAFVYQGLEVINKNPNLGLKSLIYEAGLKSGFIGAFDLGFVIGPRINAIGRLEHALDALRLFCTKDSKRARELARLLCETNTTRQKLTSLAYDEAKLQISSKRIQIVASKDWLPGIIGLVASKVCEDCNQPTIAISIGEVFSKGSARSNNGINITETMRNFSELLVDIGGHAGAAGFTIETSKIEEFKNKLETHFDSLTYEIAEPVLAIESLLERKELVLRTAKLLEDFEPFGVGNPKPIFATDNLKVEDIRLLSEGKHIKLKVDGVEAIGFGLGKLDHLLKVGQLINLAYYLEVNFFNDKETLQLKIKDIQFI